MKMLQTDFLEYKTCHNQNGIQSQLSAIAKGHLLQDMKLDS